MTSKQTKRIKSKKKKNPISLEEKAFLEFAQQLEDCESGKRDNFILIEPCQLRSKKDEDEEEGK